MGKCTNERKAEPETRRQVSQWQIMARKGSAVARYRTAPHKHPPVQSMSFGLLEEISLAGHKAANNLAPRPTPRFCPAGGWAIVRS